MRIGMLKESYAADQALFDTPSQRSLLAIGVAALLLFPFVASEYWLYLACLVGIHVVSTTGLNILTGYTGLVSLGQAAFMGVGAYAVAIAEVRLGTPFLLNLVMAGAVTAAIGIVVGVPSLRVKGLYLAIATIAASFILHFAFQNWVSLTGIRGLSIPPASIFGIELARPFALYFVIVPIACVTVLAAANLFRTRFGRAFIAIRDRDISAEVLGIPLLRTKLMSFGLSSFYAGLAGGLWAYFFRSVTPESFPFVYSILFLAAVIVGGMGTILGAVLGAVFMTLLSEVLIDAALARQELSAIGLLIYTSGSTDKPKGARLSYRTMRAQAIAASDRIGLDENTVHLSYLPLCHVAEQMLATMTPIYVGAQINFGESIRTVQEDLRELAPNMFLGVPRIWEKLHSAIFVKLAETSILQRRLFDRAFAACEPFAEIPPHRRTLRQRATFALCYWLIFRALQNFIGLRRVRVAMTGAAPIPARIVRFFRTIGVPLVEVYGATETGGIAAGQTRSALVPLCVGTAVQGVELARGGDGELLVRGDTVFSGYHKNPAATAAAFTADGWLRTGDVVEIEHGQYKIVDRLKDIMITAGGKNLSPSEIENTVKASPYIKECIVVGEARKYVAALIQVDAETLGSWAEAEGIAYSNFRSLAEHPAVRDLIGNEVARANAELAQVSHIRRFHLLTKELDHDDDEVTATMKLRRANVQAKYAAEIESLYA